MLDAEWKDIHHSRIQEWSALVVVTGAEVAMTQMPKFLNEGGVEVKTKYIALVAFGFGTLFAIVGILMTLRHRRLMMKGLALIGKIEERLGLVEKTAGDGGIFPIDDLVKAPEGKGSFEPPRLFSTSWLIISFYVLFIVFNAICFGGLLNQILVGK